MDEEEEDFDELADETESEPNDEDDEDGYYTKASSRPSSAKASKKARHSFPPSNASSQKQEKGKRGRPRKSDILPTTSAPPADAVMIPMGDKTVIDKFLSWRLSGGQQELLVKYKHMGFIHTEWLTRENIEENFDKAVKTRVKRFLEKSPWDLQWSEDEPFNPSFLKVIPYF